MPSNNPSVWLITGASSSLGHALCLAALARGDLVIASAGFQKDVDHLCSIGAYGIRLDSEMSFGQVRDRIHDAVSCYGRVDFLINNPDASPQRDSSAYDTNTFSYTAIQITKAVSQISPIRQIAVIVPKGRQPDHSQSGFGYSRETTNNAEATAQLLASGYRSKHVRVLLVKPGSIVPTSASRHAAGDPKIVVERIVAQMTERGSSEESGICVL